MNFILLWTQKPGLAFRIAVVHRNNSFVLEVGVSIKCQFSRLLHQNREIARERLVEKLDVLLNGYMSIKAQTERQLMKKSFKASTKSKNLSELKRRYQEHLASSDNSEKTGSSPEPSKVDWTTELSFWIFRWPFITVHTHTRHSPWITVGPA